jgi:hypothetical protein
VCTVNNRRFDADTEFPVELDFTAIVTFENTAPVLPEDEMIYAVMEQANFETYIQEFVWRSPPEGSIFYDVQRVVYFKREGPGV